MVEEYGWLRDQRFVKIALFPFQYIPSEGAVVWHNKIVVQVDFIGATGRSTDDPPITTINETYEKLLQENILNYDMAKAWRTPPPMSSLQQTTIVGERLRIVVQRDGLYKISYQELIDAGMAGTDPRTFRMTNQGMEVAISVVGEEDGILNEDDCILFYGEGFRGDTMAEWYADENVNWLTYIQQLPDGSTTPWKPEFTADMLEKYTTENIYWLQSVENERPLRILSVDGTPNDNVPLVPPTYRTTVHAEHQLGHWEYHFTSEDTWFWEFVTDSNPRFYNTLLTALSTETYTASVRGEYVAFNYNNLVTPDHIVNFYLNNGATPINVSSWDGRSRHRFEVDVPGSALVEGENQLGMTLVYDSGQPWVAFDWFEIDYERRYEAVNDEISFTRDITGTWRYQLESFSQLDIAVYDITNPRQPIRITGISSTLGVNGYQSEFQYTNGVSARIYAASVGSLQTAVSISRYVPPDLRSSGNGADYLIITHSEFADTAQGLANYRSSQGYRTRVIDIQDLYNEFNEGIYHPIAIKNFLEYTYANWEPPAPMYVVLVGDGHWNLLGARPNVYGTTPLYMPPYLGWVDPVQGEVDTSNLLATIAGDDPLPDMFVGRILVNTDQELQNVIDKIVVYEHYPTLSWQLNNTFIADDTPDAVGDFPAMANYIISEYIEPGYNPIRIFLDDYKDFGLCGTSPYPGGPSCPAVNSKIVDTINNTGSLFVTYIGHGDIQRWAHDQIFLYHADDPTNPNDIYYSDMDALNNINMLPIVLSMDCMDGFWINPTRNPNLAELFVRSPGKGAAATFSPTGLGVGLGHFTLMEGFFGTVYRDGLWELGAATLGAKLALYNAGYFRDMLHTYTTFGDPALRIPSPYDLTVSPDQAAQQAAPGMQLTYPIRVSNIGTLPDLIEITVDGNNWPTTPAANLLSLSAGETIEVLVTIEIPADIPGGVTDTALVRVRSDGDAAELKTVTLNSTVLVRVRLPLIRK